MLTALIILGALAVGQAYERQNQSSNFFAKAISPNVGLMVYLLHSEQLKNENIQPIPIDQNFLKIFPKVDVALEESQKLCDPWFGCSTYQNVLTKEEAYALLKALHLPHTNVANAYDNEGNRAGCVDFYGYPVEFDGKFYGIALVFPRQATEMDIERCVFMKTSK